MRFIIYDGFTQKKTPEIFRRFCFLWGIDKFHWLVTIEMMMKITLLSSHFYYKKMDNKDLQNIWWKPYMGMMIDISGWLVVPIVSALILGKWLDARYQVKPAFTIFFIALAFLLSIFGIMRESKHIMKKMENENKKDREKTK